MLMVGRQGLPQGYYNFNNYENTIANPSDAVLLYPTQSPGSLSLMVSSEAA